jgi:hypothetical protein
MDRFLFDNFCSVSFITRMDLFDIRLLSKGRKIDPAYAIKEGGN